MYFYKFLLGDFLGRVPPGGRRWQWFSFLFHKLNPFINDITKLCVDLCFIVAMTTWADDTWTLTNEAFVFVGPFHDLDIPSTFFHYCDS
jgi:hypothetical protein